MPWKIFYRLELIIIMVSKVYHCSTWPTQSLGQPGSVSPNLLLYIAIVVVYFQNKDCIKEYANKKWRCRKEERSTRNTLGECCRANIAFYLSLKSIRKSGCSSNETRRSRSTLFIGGLMLRRKMHERIAQMLLSVATCFINVGVTIVFICAFIRLHTRLARWNLCLMRRERKCTKQIDEDDDAIWMHDVWFRNSPVIDLLLHTIGWFYISSCLCWLFNLIIIAVDNYSGHALSRRKCTEI